LNLCIAFCADLNLHPYLAVLDEILELVCQVAELLVGLLALRREKQLNSANVRYKFMFLHASTSDEIHDLVA